LARLAEAPTARDAEEGIPEIARNLLPRGEEN
jgi:hypothetical protein